MPGGVNQVDKKARAVLTLLDEGQVVVTELIKQGDGTAEINFLKIKKRQHMKLAWQRLCTLGSGRKNKHSRGFDGDATLLLILSCVSKTGFSCTG